MCSAASMSKPGTGELFGLLGLNGAEVDAGQIAGGRVPDDGTVRVCGHVAGSPGARGLARLPGRAVPLPGLVDPSDEPLKVHQQLTGIDLVDGDERASCSTSSSGHVRTAGVGAHVKGMQQRLGLAEALIGSPQPPLLHERTSALDPAGCRTWSARCSSGCAIAGSACCSTRTCCPRSSWSATAWRSSTTARSWPPCTPAQLSRPGGMQVETASGWRTFAEATRDDAPRIVRELVAAGRGCVQRAGADAHVEDGYLEAVGAAPAKPPDEAVRADYKRDRSRPVRRRGRRAQRQSARRAARRADRRALLAARVAPPPGVRDRRAAHAGLPDPLRPRHMAGVQGGDELGAGNEVGVDPEPVVGAQVVGLAMFAILFLGTILVVFLTLGVVRGDAERGLLSRCSSARSRAARCCSAGGRATAGRARTWCSWRSPRSRSPRRWRPVAGPHGDAAAGAGARRRHHRRAVARGVDRARQHGERDRRSRRSAAPPPARSARSPRRSVPTASTGSPTSPAGRSRSRRSTRRASPT